MTRDDKTLQLEQLLLNIAEVAEKNNKQYYFGGGFAIDIFFGGITRPHEDLDFYPREEDTNWWKEWFTSHGYVVSKDIDMNNLVNAFSVLDKNNEYFADVYPISVASNGEIIMLVKDGTQQVWDGLLTIQGASAIWEGKSWNDVKCVEYKGQKVLVENYKTILSQKENYIKLHPGEKLSEKHLHDFKIAGVQPQV